MPSEQSANNEPTPCRKCGRLILWALSRTGARLPLDASPAATYFIEPGNPPRAVRVTDMLRTFNVPTYVSHFGTCPNANDFHNP